MFFLCTEGFPRFPSAPVIMPFLAQARRHTALTELEPDEGKRRDAELLSQDGVI